MTDLAITVELGKRSAGTAYDSAWREWYDRNTDGTWTRRRDGATFRAVETRATVILTATV